MSKTFAMKNGCVVMQPDGQPLMIEAYDKIQQDINHALSHPYDPEQDYGNELLVNPVTVVERSAIPGLVQRDVGAAISRLRRFQSLIPKRYMPRNEKIEKIRSISVRKTGNLGVAFLVVVSVTERSQEDIRTVFRIHNQHLED